MAGLPRVFEIMRFSRPPVRFAPRRAARVAAAWVLTLASLAAQAQTLDAAAPHAPRLESEPRVLPVWSNASGRVEALLLLDPIEPGESVSANALDRVLNASTPRLGLGARVRLDNGSQVRSALQLDPDAGLALLCDGRAGLTGTLGALGEHCLLATLGNDDPMLAGAARGASLGLGWQSPGELIDLSFGLSWLELNAPSSVAWLNPLQGGATAPGLLGTDLYTIGAWAQRFDSLNLRLDSLINLGPQTRMLLGGDLGRSRLLSPDGTPLEWETAALSFGLGYGKFSGQLTGRLVELPRGGQWNTLDIGLSWRTPWRGELSVGAKNVLGADPSNWPLSELPAIEDPSARVPYVRYQQDL